MIKLVKEKLAGKTAIIVTHKPRIRSICNRSYLFENGILSEETEKEV
jgi:ABC-type lipoprotein export system ATPase subunit